MRVARAEQMFNMLNRRATRGKKPPIVCKSLDSVSRVTHGPAAWFEGRFYVLECRQLRNEVFPGVGLRIALIVLQPVLMRIPSGKD
jgi:hypothetical protein